MTGGDGHDEGMAIPAQRSHQDGRQEDREYHQNMHERREGLQGSPRGDDEHPIQRPRGNIPSTNIPPRTRPEAQKPQGGRVDTRNGATPSGNVGLGMCINTTCTPPPQQQQAFNTDKEPTFRYFQLGRIPGRNPKPEYGALRSRSCRTNVTSESRCAGYVTKGTPLLVIDQTAGLSSSRSHMSKTSGSCENLLQAEVEQVTNGWTVCRVLRRASQAGLALQG